MRNLWRRWRRPVAARARTASPAGQPQEDITEAPPLRPGLVLRERERGRIFRLDRRLRGANGRSYWILAEIDEAGRPVPARRLVSEDRLGQWCADS